MFGIILSKQTLRLYYKHSCLKLKSLKIIFHFYIEFHQFLINIQKGFQYQVRNPKKKGIMDDNHRELWKCLCPTKEGPDLFLIK